MGFFKNPRKIGVFEDKLSDSVEKTTTKWKTETFFIFSVKLLGHCWKNYLGPYTCGELSLSGLYGNCVFSMVYLITTYIYLI